MIRTIAVSTVFTLLIPATHGTNGMNMEGYGPIATSMGGASMAYDNGTAAVINTDKIAGAIPYERHSRTSQCGEHHFADHAGRLRHPRVRIDDLEIEIRFPEMVSRKGLALHSSAQAHLRSPIVIEDPASP